MSLGGYRPNSGRKKGSIPWNKGIPMSETSKKRVSLSKKGTPSWNKGKKMSDAMRQKLLGNTHGSANKGRTFKIETLKKMSLIKIGKPSPAKGRFVSEKERDAMSIRRRAYFLKLNPNYDYRLDGRTKAGNKRIRAERLRKFGGSHTLSQWETLKIAYGFICPCCKKKEPEIKLTRDHIVSLSNGGSDNIENIQPLCNPCNARKHTRTIRY